LSKKQIDYFVVIFLISIIYLLFNISVSDNILFAISPSFVRQEIIDDINDWELWKSKSNTTRISIHDGKEINIQNALNLTECQIYKDYLIPDIESVSYTSDGNKINATIWLTEDFKEPILQHPIDTSQEELQVIKTVTKNKTLMEHILNKKAQINPISLSNLEESNITLANNYTGYKLIYPTLSDFNELEKTLYIIIIINNNLYEFIFKASNNSYEDLQPIINQILNSFRIIDYEKKNKDTNRFLNYQESYKDMRIYNSNGIYLAYPIGWEIKEQKNKYGNYNELTITFRAPFQDTLINEPSWQEFFYTMSLDINSVHDTGTDYRIILKKDNMREDKKSSWNKEIQEISAYNKYGIVNKSKYEYNLSDQFSSFNFLLNSVAQKSKLNCISFGIGLISNGFFNSVIMVVSSFFYFQQYQITDNTFL
jgi:hypothetical protein